MQKIITMGVYGFTEQQFFQALVDEGVTVFCDLRFRRGVRGADYTFANSKRLQIKLQAMGIRYLYYRSLALAPSTRRMQYEEDDRAGFTKKTRVGLSPEFIQEYTDTCLVRLNSQAFLTYFDENDIICLFCVEHVPEACHRSLVAQKLHNDLQLPVAHIY